MKSNRNGPLGVKIIPSIRPDKGNHGCFYLVSENFMVMPKSWVMVG